MVQYGLLPRVLEENGLKVMGGESTIEREDVCL
jgi:hypothetical protein